MAGERPWKGRIMENSVPGLGRREGVGDWVVLWWGDGKGRN